MKNNKFWKHQKKQKKNKTWTTPKKKNTQKNKKKQTKLTMFNYHPLQQVSKPMKTFNFNNSIPVEESKYKDNTTVSFHLKNNEHSKAIIKPGFDFSKAFNNQLINQQKANAFNKSDPTKQSSTSTFKLTQFLKGRVKLWKLVFQFLQIPANRRHSLKQICKCFKYALPQSPLHLIVPSIRFPTLNSAVDALNVWCQKQLKKQSNKKSSAALINSVVPSEFIHNQQVQVTWYTWSNKITSNNSMYNPYPHNSIPLKTTHTGTGVVKCDNWDGTFDIRLDKKPKIILVNQYNEPLLIKKINIEEDFWLDSVPSEQIEPCFKNEESKSEKTRHYYTSTMPTPPEIWLKKGNYLLTEKIVFHKDKPKDFMELR